MANLSPYVLINMVLIKEKTCSGNDELPKPSVKADRFFTAGNDPSPVPKGTLVVVVVVSVVVSEIRSRENKKSKHT